MNTDPTSNDPYGPVANVYDAMGDRPSKPTDPLLALSPLLPCPFCGNDQPHVQSDLDNCVSMVVCGHCGSSSDWNDSPEDSITAWNTRAANARGGDGKVRLWRNAYVGALISKFADEQYIGYEEARLLAEEAANDLEAAFEQATETLKQRTPTPGSEVRS